MFSGASLAGYTGDLDNPKRHPLLYWRGTVGQAIVLKAIVNGVTGPADGTLGGNLFHASLGEWPLGFGPPSVSQTGGFTSIGTFTPLHAGHHLFVFRRPSGGAVGVPIYVTT